jgi:hypothetical protein
MKKLLFIVMILEVLSSCALAKQNQLTELVKNEYTTTIYPMSLPELSRLRQNFLKNNLDLNLEDKNVTVDTTFRVVSNVISQKAGSKTPDLVDWSRKFIKKNAGFLNLSNIDWSKLVFKYKKSDPNIVEIRSPLMPYPGFNGTSAESGWIASIDMTFKKGRFYSLLNRTRSVHELGDFIALPPFPANIPEVQNAVLGRPLSYFNFAGLEISVGNITKTILSEPVKALHVKRTPDRSLVITLAWLIIATKDDLRFKCFIHPQSLEVIAITPDFFT